MDKKTIEEINIFLKKLEHYELDNKGNVIAD